MLQRIRRWVKRIVLGLLGLFVISLIANFIYTRFNEARIYAAPLPTSSLLVDVGGRNIHMRGMGLEHDSPAVVLISGFAYRTTTDSGWWAGVQPELARTMRVYAFDYAGYAWSDPNPDGLSHTNAADDLHTALVKLGEKEVILVGFATGSNTTLVYYNRYPDEPRVLGILWLDADVLHPKVIDLYRDHTPKVVLTLVHTLTDVVGGWPWYQVIHAEQERWVMEERLSPSARGMFDWDYYNRVTATRQTRKVTHARLDFVSRYSADLDYAASLPLPDKIPLYAAQTDMLHFQSERNPERATVNEQRGPYMIEWYRAASENTPGGRYIHISDSEHFAMLDQPDTLIGVIKDMMELVTTR
jgi:pimeloyl-ACP methyl ester carboxylesterase